MVKIIISYKDGKEMEIEHTGIGTANEHYRDLKKHMAHERSQIVKISMFKQLGNGMWAWNKSEEKGQVE